MILQTGGFLVLYVLRQAPEWYREEAVGRSVRRAAISAETNPLSSKGGEALNPGEAEQEAVQRGGGRGRAGGAEGVEAGRSESGAATLSREHVFVTTKIHPRDFSAERIGATVEASKTNLQVRAAPLSVCVLVCTFGLIAFVRFVTGLLFWLSSVTTET